MPEIRIELESVTRGNGKIYLRCSCNDLPEGATLLAASALADGTSVTARVVPFQGSSVCIVPLLDVSQTLTVRAAAAGSICAEASALLDPQRIQRRAQLNTLLRNQRATSIRNCDDSPAVKASSRSQLELYGIVDAYDHDVIKGLARILAPTRAELQGVVTICAFGPDGKPLDHTFIPMGSSTSQPPELSGTWRREDAFSLRVPKGLSTFFVALSVEGAPELSTFAALPQNLAADLHGWWDCHLPSAENDGAYDAWFRAHRTGVRELALQQRCQADFAIRPKFSLIVPLYKTPVDFFREMADSALAQTYPNFELLLVNSSPEDEALCQVVEEYCRRDPRVREVRLDHNLGIVGNTNEGIRAAGADVDFLAFYDHDDTIEPDLLWYYVAGINAYPTTDLLYCDEDHLKDGRYIIPFFKPDWDPQREETENYVCHLLTVRKSIVDSFSKLPDTSVENAQDHNMTFMVAERARNVFHCRKVLYHWRMHAGSTSQQGPTSKPHTFDAQRRSVQGHLDRSGIPADAVMHARVFERSDVQYHFETKPLVSVLIPNKDAAPLLARCVDSILRKTTWPNYEVVICENNSTQPQTFAYYRQAERDSRVRVLQVPCPDGPSFSHVCNVGVREARGEYVILLNNDTEVMSPDWIELLLGPVRFEGMGAAGAKLLYPDELIQHAGVQIGGVDEPVHYYVCSPGDGPGFYVANILPHRSTAVTGACLLTTKAIWNEVGGMDEGLPFDYDDVDLCLKMRAAGYELLEQSNAVLTHYESATRAKHDAPGQSRVRYLHDLGVIRERFARQLAYPDPYYSPDLLPVYYQLRW